MLLNNSTYQIIIIFSSASHYFRLEVFLTSYFYWSIELLWLPREVREEERDREKERERRERDWARRDWFTILLSILKMSTTAGACLGQIQKLTNQFKSPTLLVCVQLWNHSLLSPCMHIDRNLFHGSFCEFQSPSCGIWGVNNPVEGSPSLTVSLCHSAFQI